MPRHASRALPTLAAALAMAICVSATSSARVFSLSNANFRAVWTALEFLGAPFGAMRCRVTMEGSFHSRTISKVEKALIGHITRASVAGANCTGGRATIHQESLPWHVTYSGFTGRLPSITSIRLLFSGARLQIEEGFGLCTVTTEANHQARAEMLINANGEPESLRPDGSMGIPVTGPFCPESEQLESPAGDGRITILGQARRIRVTLI
jgi:hypothetical protein